MHPEAADMNGGQELLPWFSAHRPFLIEFLSKYYVE